MNTNTTTTFYYIWIVNKAKLLQKAKLQFENWNSYKQIVIMWDAWGRVCQSFGRLLFFIAWRKLPLSHDTTWSWSYCWTGPQISNATIIAILLAHKDLNQVALLFPPIQCCLQTEKAPICKEFGQIVLSNIEWGKGSVCGLCVGQWLMTLIVV